MKLIVGSAGFQLPGWVSTDKDTLDITSPVDWAKVERQHEITNILCEHVLEHLPIDQVKNALSLMYSSLDYGGVLRVAVPDWNNPDAEYQRIINIPEHVTKFTEVVLRELLEEAGFKVEIYEWFGDNGFNYRHFFDKEGYVQRSYTNDERNAGGKIFITSVIADAIKD